MLNRKGFKVFEPIEAIGYTMEEIEADKKGASQKLST